MLCCLCHRTLTRTLRSSSRSSCRVTQVYNYVWQPITNSGPLPPDVCFHLMHTTLVCVHCTCMTSFKLRYWTCYVTQIIVRLTHEIWTRLGMTQSMLPALYIIIVATLTMPTIIWWVWLSSHPLQHSPSHHL